MYASDIRGLQNPKVLLCLLTKNEKIIYNSKNYAKLYLNLCDKICMLWKFWVFRIEKNIEVHESQDFDSQKGKNKSQSRCALNWWIQFVVCEGESPRMCGFLSTVKFSLILSAWFWSARKMIVIVNACSPRFPFGACLLAAYNVFSSRLLSYSLS